MLTYAHMCHRIIKWSLLIFLLCEICNCACVGFPTVTVFSNVLTPMYAQNHSCRSFQHRVKCLVVYVNQVWKPKDMCISSFPKPLPDIWPIYQQQCCLAAYEIDISISLQWRHNERDGVSNHPPHDCLLNCLFRRRPKKTSKLRVTGLGEGNSPVTCEFPAQRTVTRKMFPFDDVIMWTSGLR